MDSENESNFEERWEEEIRVRRQAQDHNEMYI